MKSDCFHHWYGPTHFVIGPGCVDELESSAERTDISRVLLVTSRSVAADPGLLDPVVNGLGDVAVTVFDDVSIKKQLDTVVSAVDIVEELDIDGIVSLGGGSTVDAARAVSAVAATDADPQSTPTGGSCSRTSLRTRSPSSQFPRRCPVQR
jgi:alcohol dehydrogenase